jgi:hypothetical protein
MFYDDGTQEEFSPKDVIVCYDSVDGESERQTGLGLLASESGCGRLLQYCLSQLCRVTMIAFTDENDNYASRPLSVPTNLHPSSLWVITHAPSS